MISCCCCGCSPHCRWQRCTCHDHWYPWQYRHWPVVPAVPVIPCAPAPRFGRVRARDVKRAERLIAGVR